jgi:dTMP kinase
MAGRTELFLFLADRAEHVESVIKPALATNEFVLCDRYADSTIVYQGYGRGLDREMLLKLNECATQGLVPNLTILLDLPAEIGLGRLKQKDRLDLESLAFHERVRNGFLAEAQLDPDRWVIVDATASEDEVANKCLEHISQRFEHMHKRALSEVK